MKSRGPAQRLVGVTVVAGTFAGQAQLIQNVGSSPNLGPPIREIPPIKVKLTNLSLTTEG